MCKHPHWIVETSTAPTAKGVCSQCHEEREFPNQLPVEAYGRQKQIEIIGTSHPEYWEREVERNFARDW